MIKYQPMNNAERGFRGITSIPWRTSLDIVRGGATIRTGGHSLPGGARRVSRELTAGEPDWSKIVAKHVFKKPSGREKARPEPLYKRGRKIEWKMEVIEDHNDEGGLGIILQFTEIEFTKASFRKSKHSSPSSPVFYIPIGYNDEKIRLFLATRGDILEFQVAPDQMYVNPFLQEELIFRQLTKTHNPDSMAVFQNNGTVIVGYNSRI